MIMKNVWVVAPRSSFGTISLNYSITLLILTLKVNFYSTNGKQQSILIHYASQFIFEKVLLQEHRYYHKYSS